MAALGGVNGKILVRRGIQDIGSLPPPLVLEGVIQEEILPGEPLAGDDDGTLTEVRHYQGVLTIVNPGAEKRDRVGRGGRHRFPVQVHRLLETVLPVQAVSFPEEGIRLGPEAGRCRQE